MHICDWFAFLMNPFVIIACSSLICGIISCFEIDFCYITIAALFLCLQFAWFIFSIPLLSFFIYLFLLVGG